VRQEIADALSSAGAVTLVSSAACGADLLALSEAERLGIRRRIVLPFSRERFRATSVVDRGEEWGKPFDLLLDAAEAEDDLVVLGLPNDDAAYRGANGAIVEQALVEASRLEVPDRIALVVWEGAPRDGGDATADFKQKAERAGFAVRTVLTR
jgi:hypothetical protein